MCRIEHDPPEAATYTKQRICDNTLDDAQLATRCPLDNVRSSVATSPPRYSTGQLDRLPTEILFQVLLYADIPSLTGFRRTNRRAMELVDSVPQQTHSTAIYSIEPWEQRDALRAVALATISI
ncbi:hypothetical protein ACQRIU_001441 [Beauveria bassiana]